MHIHTQRGEKNGAREGGGESMGVQDHQDVKAKTTKINTKERKKERERER
jgi:hypothetical protein